MLALPPVNPAVGFVSRVRLPRDYYIRVAGNDYSVDLAAIGRMVDIAADLNQVTVTLDGKTLACHDRVWSTAQTITDPAHVTQAAQLLAHSLTVADMAEAFSDSKPRSWGYRRRSEMYPNRGMVAIIGYLAGQNTSR